MLVMKANQLSALAQTSANTLMPRRELTDVTMGRQSQIIKFRRYSVMGPFARNLSEENSGLKFKWTHYPVFALRVARSSARWRQHAVEFFEQLLPENRSPCYAGAMTPPIDNARACGAETRRPWARQKYITTMSFNQAIRKKEKIAWGVGATS
jgi:hypothetical protein